MKGVVVFLFSLIVAGCATSNGSSAGNDADVSQAKIDRFLAKSIDNAEAVISDDVGTVERKGNQIIITLKGDRSFTHDSAEVRVEGQKTLEKLSRLIANMPDSRVFIAGHTDSVGSEEYNRKLSMKRAQSVSDLLADNGVNAKRLGVFGFGESAPIADNMMATGRQANRRIEVRLTPMFDKFLK